MTTHNRVQRRTTVILWIQGMYFLLTGLWPLVHYKSFEWVTGPKTDHIHTGRIADHWLVFTVAVLITSIALGILTAAWRQTASIEIVVLAVSASLALMSIDFIYVARDVIRPIYLLDAGIEIVLLLGWAWCWIGHRKKVGQQA